MTKIRLPLRRVFPALDLRHQEKKRECRLVSARFTLVVGYLFFMAGCSASHYSKPIETFAKATANANAALADLNKTVTAEYTDFLSQRIRTDLKQAIKGKDGECGLGSSRCRIVLANPDDSTNPQIFPPEP